MLAQLSSLRWPPRAAMRLSPRQATKLRHLTPNGFLGLFRPALVFSIQLINKLAKPLRVLLCPADSCTNSDHTLASPGSIQGDLLSRSRDYKLMIYSPDSLEFIM
ncbi:hypothetical protein QC763_0051740 [Podospora pseudopauciseta]|uniref:Uncharacterized protein n=1 Tax=Podospora pseudopauciseta TaxID=2093780 RepID=A0ABR0HGC0_9PEZI|nr:hypothetical protein QC763_0051740 [Podospora pseudopauciseta]